MLKMFEFVLAGGEVCVCPPLLFLVPVCLSVCNHSCVCRHEHHLVCASVWCVCLCPERIGGKFMSECFCYRDGNYGSFLITVLYNHLALMMHTHKCTNTHIDTSSWGTNEFRCDGHWSWTWGRGNRERLMDKERGRPRDRELRELFSEEQNNHFCMKPLCRNDHFPSHLYLIFTAGTPASLQMNPKKYQYIQMTKVY